MTDQSSEAKKSTISFGFSKMKSKTSLIKTESSLFKDELKIKEETKVELIASISDKKVTSVEKPTSDNRPLVIPCQKNRDILGSHLKSKSEPASHAKSEDMDAIKALMDQAKRSKEDENEKEDSLVVKSDLRIELNTDALDNVADADYEAVDIEKFGKAALRGMGWNEKEGLGLTNKRTFQLKDVELRPKGLGLGAGFNSKKQKTEGSERSDADTSSSSSKLSYSKGAYVEIMAGKHEGELGQVVSFDDGLNRILVRLARNDQTLSIIQTLTRLITKHEYEKLLKSSK